MAWARAQKEQSRSTASKCSQLGYIRRFVSLKHNSRFAHDLRAIARINQYGDANVCEPSPLSFAHHFNLLRVRVVEDRSKSAGFQIGSSSWLSWLSSSAASASSAVAHEALNLSNFSGDEATGFALCSITLSFAWHREAGLDSPLSSVLPSNSGIPTQHGQQETIVKVKGYKPIWLWLK